MVVRYPQPAGDVGSRRNRVDRKGDVDKVSSGFVGIVNVYQLIPKGGKAIKVSDIGIVKPEGAPSLPQTPVKAPGMSKAELKDIDNQIKRARDQMENTASISYDFVFDSHAKTFKLASFAGGKRNSYVEDIGSYEQILQKYPNKVKQYSLSNPNDLKTINKAVHIIQHTKTDKQKALNRQAMRLGVRIQTMRDWYNMPVMNPDKAFKKMDRVAKEIADEKQQQTNTGFGSITGDIMKMTDTPVFAPRQIAPTQSTQIAIPQSTEISVQTEKQLPLSIEGRRQITLMDANTPGKYYKLNTISQIQGADSSNVVYAMHDGKVEYYADISKLSIERKRKLVKSNLKRPRLLFKIKSKTKKIITAYSMKKTLLGKLKIRYRRKK